MHAHSDNVKRATVRWLVAGVMALCVGGCRNSSSPKAEVVPPGTVSAVSGSVSAAGASDTRWFDDLAAPLALQQSEADELVAWIRHRWQSGEAAEAPVLSARLASDKELRIVFLSASDGRHPAQVAFAVEHGVAAALRSATDEVRARGAGRSSLKWLALDIVEKVWPEQVVGPDDALVMTRGIHGLALARGTGVAFLGSEILGRRLVTRDLTIHRKRMAKWVSLKARNPVEVKALQRLFEHDGPIPVRAFTTESFFVDVSTGVVQRSLRGHPAERRVDDNQLRTAIAQGGEYLARATEADGRYVYAYLAKQDGVKDKYNMVRHAGTAFAMIQAYELLRDPAILAAGERALAYMKKHIVRYGAAKDDISALAFKGKIKLGGVALAALALATHVRVTGQKNHLMLAQKLCRYMVGNQRKDGSFVHQRANPGGRELPFVSMYYPGEALLGLLSVYRLDGDKRWLDAAERGARFLIEVRDAKVPTKELEHDHWLLYALELLHEERPKPMFLKHAMRISEAIITAQIQSGLPPDQIGAYALKEPRATPIATRNEGLMAAYRMARKNGEDAMAERILRTVELGNEVLISMRLAPSRSLYLQHPDRAIGGVTRSHQNFEVRIDYVQHSISAWLALLSARAERSASVGPRQAPATAP